MTDSEAIQKLKINLQDEGAFRHLIKTYQEKLYYIIRRIVVFHEDADDVLQNTFLKIWKGLPNFNEESEFYTWAYRIATNEAITFINKKKKENNISLENVSFFMTAPKAEFNYDGDEIQQKLEEAIITLPEKQRAVFHLKYFDDLKYDEISKILDTSVGALKASYHHAVKKIEQFLESN